MCVCLFGRKYVCISVCLCVLVCVCEIVYKKKNVAENLRWTRLLSPIVYSAGTTIHISIFILPGRRSGNTRAGGVYNVYPSQGEYARRFRDDFNFEISEIIRHLGRTHNNNTIIHEIGDI